MDGLNKWDGRYFITISKFDYQETSWIAFFPFYPLLINLLSGLFGRILHLDYPTINFLAAYTINVLCFTVSCIALYKLTQRLFNDKLFAINTVKWFAYNPSSIFFSATYTESLYSSLLLTAIWLLYQRFPSIQREQNFDLILFNSKFDKNEFRFRNRLPSAGLETVDEHNEFVKLFSHRLDGDLVRKLLNKNGKFLIAILLLTLASFTRSNGIINVGFFWYLFLLDNFKSLFYRNVNKLFNLNNLISFLILLASTCLVVAPFFVVQYVHQIRLCNPNASDHLINKLLPASPSLESLDDRPDDRICRIEFWKLYSHVQATYWNVGLFNYYQFRKLPNFILATPMLTLVMFILKYFIESSKSSSNLIKSGLGSQFWNKTTLLFPFVLHLLFLTLFSLFFINIEVLTRLICSSSPIIFWSICKLPRKQQTYVKIYFAVYFFVGIFAFSNFLPWT